MANYQTIVIGGEHINHLSYFSVSTFGVGGTVHSGTFSLNMPFTTGSQGFQGTLNFPDSSRWRKMSIQFWIRFTAAPTAPVNLLTGLGANNQLTLTTNRKLKIAGGSEGATAMAVDTWYQVEYIIDKDWRGANLGTALCRINEGSTESTFDGTPSVSSLGLGHTMVKGDTNPATSIFLDDIFILLSDSTTERIPWPNTQTCEVKTGPAADVRLPIADGTNDDWTGVSDNTDKFTNVDESNPNTTDYVTAGDNGSALNQSFNYTTVASYPGTIRGITVWNVLTHSDNTGATGAELRPLIRHDGVNYTPYPVGQVLNTYVPIPLGYAFQPDDNSSVWTAADLDALEGGVALAATTANVRNTKTFLTVAHGDAFTSNGAVPGTALGRIQYKVLQSINRSNTY